MILSKIILLVTQVLATSTLGYANLSTGQYTLDNRNEGFMNSVAESIQRRQVQQGLGKSDKNMTLWSMVTEEACIKSIKSKINRVTNPSGMVVCYNLPFLSEKTGVFEADLRIFMVSPATGPFSNIPSDKIQVSLDYNGATVSPVNASVLKRQSDDGTSFVTLPYLLKEKNLKRESSPKLIQVYDFVGQVNKTLLPIDTEALQKVLVPNVSLSAIDSTGAKVTASLSTDELTFVNGVFAQKAPTKALLAPPIQTLVVAPNAPFVVPGLNILIFPIGLIITGIWTILFIATLGYGTFGRIQWRDRFRENKAKETRSSMSRI